jgi:oligopeptide/dipeptide ABC transporter ATP-binding protein
MGKPVLRVEGLRTHFRLRQGLLKAVDDVSFSVEAGKVLCIVGESGSGKSVTALSILRLIDPPGRIEAGSIHYRDQDLLAMPEREMAGTIRGNRVGMIFQDPMTSLNPSFTIGDQIAEGITAHQKVSRAEARAKTIELLRLVGIPHAKERYSDYPHHFSGGMRQRVLIAAAIACEPDLLIADEPTTALDVTIQAQILRLLADLQKRLNSAMILITHDLGVVAAMADDVMVMYAGKMVEYADVETLFRSPRHPYTIGLLNSVIGLDEPTDADLRSIPGVPPVPINMPAGCSFQPRCTQAVEACTVSEPSLRLAGPGHPVTCHRVEGAPEEGL